MIAENCAGQDQTSCETFVLDTANVDDRPLVDPELFKSLEKVPESKPYEHPDDASKAKPPRFIIHLPAEQKVYNGERLHVRCKVEGYPYPKLIWLKDDQPMMASTRFTTNYEPFTGDIEVIIEFTKEIDKAFYQCRAENCYGSDETFMSIIVIDIPSVDETPQTAHPDSYKTLDLPSAPLNEPNSGVYDPENDKAPEPPVVIIPLEDTRITELQPITLTCKIYGNPKPKVDYGEIGTDVD